MKRVTAAVLAATLATTGCATIRNSAVNPLNWFGPGQPSASVPAEGAAGNPLLPRRSPAASLFRQNRPAAYAGQPVAQISELLIERRPGGAIIRATAIADRIGPFEARLVRDESAPAGSLAYTFRALQRPGPRNAGPDARKVTAATYLSDNELAGIASIAVRGRDNALVSQR
ncbi:hypothetical protein [Roseivivax sp. CAU 1761]